MINNINKMIRPLRKKILISAFFLFVTGCVIGNGQGIVTNRQKQYQTTYFDLFDTVTTITGYTQTEEEFQEIANSIYEQLKRYHRLFDIYHEYAGNNLKTVNKQAGIAPVKVEQEIIELLLDCKQYYELTDGAVNTAMGSVLSLWHEARNAGLENPQKAVLPKEEALNEAANHCSFEKIVIDEDAKTVFIREAGQSLDVGAIAKGWAVERACENVPAGFLISVGGNVCVTGAKPEGNGEWIIGIQKPEAGSNEYLEKIPIQQGSVVTSGDYQRYYEVEGKQYHHLIDPETLYPAEKWKSVTVVCDDSGLADALSTALFVLSKEEGEQILEQCGAEAIWIDAEGEIYYSSGW